MKHNILAVSHDAGGAEVLSSYLSHKRKDYSLLRCVVKGSAERAFIGKGLRRYLIDVNKGKKLIFNRQVNLLLTSTSWRPWLEIDFIKLARKHSITTVAVLEHWMNYKERFKYPHKGWRGNLPDEIWVVDELARKIAKEEFGEAVKIRIKPNFYFRDLKSEYSKTAASKDRRCFNILFLSEPAAEHKALNKKKIKFNEIEKVTKLTEFMKGLDYRKPILFKIRQHTIENPSKYSAIIKYNSNNRDFKIALSDPKRDSLVKDIKSADAVIGMQSPALIIASLFKDTICCCDQSPLRFSAYNIKQAGPSLKGLEQLLYKRSSHEN